MPGGQKACDRAAQVPNYLYGLTSEAVSLSVVSGIPPALLVGVAALADAQCVQPYSVLVNPALLSTPCGLHSRAKGCLHPPPDALTKQVLGGF